MANAIITIKSKLTNPSRLVGVSNEYSQYAGLISPHIPVEFTYVNKKKMT